MQPRNPDWDNPNMPNQDWGSQNPNMPNQNWGQQNPNMPNYDPNAQAQEWGQQKQNMPNYDPNMQGQRQGGPGQQAPHQGYPGQQAPLQSNMYAAPSDSPYSDVEWKTLLSAPLKVGKAMMFASPSGPIGLVQETKAMFDSLQTLLAQKSTSPLLNALGQSAKTIMDSARSSNPQQVITELAGTSRDPNVCRTDALNDCQQASVLLRNTSPQDAGEYKQFVFNCAQKVAEAANEGGMLNTGGSRISPAEQDLLRDVAGALGMQRA
ncbi:MAG: hypothetical protein ABI234_11570 [Ktedonobacteraceae bacterium]